MRFVVPILSLVALAVLLVWVLSSGQLNKLSMTAELSWLTEAVPYLLLTITVAQGIAIYLLMRYGKPTLAPESSTLDVDLDVVRELKAKSSPDQVNTEWSGYWMR